MMDLEKTFEEGYPIAFTHTACYGDVKPEKKDKVSDKVAIKKEKKKASKSSVDSADSIHQK